MQCRDKTFGELAVRYQRNVHINRFSPDDISVCGLPLEGSRGNVDDEIQFATLKKRTDARLFFCSDFIYFFEGNAVCTQKVGGMFCRDKPEFHFMEFLDRGKQFQFILLLSER